MTAPTTEEVREALCYLDADESYGVAVSEDPRHFAPDPECSTEEERAQHAADVAAWDRGERPERNHRCERTGKRIDSTHATPWGLGVTTQPHPLVAPVLALAEHRDALAAEVARRGELLAAERARYVLLQATLDAERRAGTERSAVHMEEVARLSAEVARLREVIATKYAIERSSLGVSALIEERGTIATAAGLPADASAEEVRKRVSALARTLSLVSTWRHEHGVALVPSGADTYGEGMRAAKGQISAILSRLAEEAGGG